jgi:hypothetical protein
MAENPNLYGRFTEAFEEWADGATEERKKFPPEQVQFPVGFNLVHKLFTGDASPEFKIQEDE